MCMPPYLTDDDFREAQELYVFRQTNPRQVTIGQLRPHLQRLIELYRLPANLAYPPEWLDNNSNTLRKELLRKIQRSTAPSLNRAPP